MGGITGETIGQAKFEELVTRHEKYLTEMRGQDFTSDERIALSKCVLVDVSIERRALVAATFAGCRFVDFHARDCDLNGVDFYENFAEVSCYFERCNFHKAELNDSNLTGANLAGSGFTRADLTGVVLFRANLAGCKFDWAWLIDADLRFANLEGASFVGTRFRHTRMYNNRPFLLEARKGAMNYYSNEDIDLSEAGDLSELGGVDLLDRLKR